MLGKGQLFSVYSTDCRDIREGQASQVLQQAHATLDTHQMEDFLIHRFQLFHIVQLCQLKQFVLW